MRGLTRVEVIVLEDASEALEDFVVEWAVEHPDVGDDMSPEECEATDRLHARGLVVPDPRSTPACTFWNITEQGRVALRCQRAADAV